MDVVTKKGYTFLIFFSAKKGLTFLLDIFLILMPRSTVWQTWTAAKERTSRRSQQLSNLRLRSTPLKLFDESSSNIFVKTTAWKILISARAEVTV